MAVAFHVEIPAAIAENQIGKYLQDNQGLYRGALDLTANPFDPYSQVDQVEIASVNTEACQIVIEYRVIFSAFHACHDRSYTDSSVRRVTAVRDGRILTFVRFEPFDERSPGDEL